MSLLDKASLIVTPNAYKESKLYSVVPNTTLGDMDVVRATTATRVNSAGLIEEVPRNLFSYSEMFSDSSWTKTNCVITPNIETAPNGTLTADKFILNVGADPLAPNSTGLFKIQTLNSGTYNYSIFAKAGERNIIRWRDGGFSGSFLVVNLTNGTFTNGEPTRFINPQVISFPNGWYRISFTTAVIASPQNYPLRFGDTGQTGDGVSGGFIWGAQLEQGSTATEYFPTTTRLNIPRIDYTNGSCPSLLVEPQRTNVATNSDGNVSTYGSATNVTNASSSFNSFVNAIQFPSTGLALAYKSVVTTAQTYTISVFVKMDDNSVPILSASTTTGNFCLVIEQNIATSNLKVESYGNNVYRLSATGPSLGINLGNGLIRFSTQVLKSFKITGIQLEAGSYPTSYIPTVASSVTRNADVISKTGISSLIGQTEGTIFCEIQNWQTQLDKVILALSDGSTANYLQISSNSVTGDLQSVIFTGGVPAALGSIVPVIGQNYKIAIGYKLNDYAIYINGIQVGTFNSKAAPSSLTRFDLGSVEFLASNYQPRTPYKVAALWKTRLTNAELATLTTL